MSICFAKIRFGRHCDDRTLQTVRAALVAARLHPGLAVMTDFLDDLVAVLAPRSMTLVAAFTPRGGISTRVIAKHEAKSSGAGKSD